MAKQILINTIHSDGRTFRAGTSYDERFEAEEIVAIGAAGGVLVPDSDTIVAEAALRANQNTRRAGSDSDPLMLAAYTRSLSLKVDPLARLEPDGTLDQLAELQARIDAASAAWVADTTPVSQRRERLVEIGNGELRLSASPSMRSGVALRGQGTSRTLLFPLPSWAPGVGLADEPTNALIKAQGITTGAVSTTLVGPAIHAHDIITVASAVGIVVGMRLRIQGHNVAGFPNDMAQMSDGVDVVLTEIVEVAAINGVELTLTRPLSQHHMSGLGVVSVDVVEHFSIGGFDLRCDGGTFAVGILVDHARDFHIHDLSGAGFSRAMIETRLGCADFRRKHIHSRGENNAICYSTSAMRFEDSKITSAPAGARVHVNGIPRALLTYRSRCTQGEIDFDLYHGACGVRAWGGVDLHFRGAVRDFDCSNVGARDPEIGPSGSCGSIEGGAGPLNIAEFGVGCTWKTTIEDHQQPHDTDQAAFYHHDHINAEVDVYIANDGPAPGSVLNGKTFRATGMLASDTIAGKVKLHVRGVNFGMRLTGVPSFDCSELFAIGVTGNNTPSVIGVFVEGALLASPIFRDVRVESLNAFVRFSGAAQAAPYYPMVFDSYTQNDQRFKLNSLCVNDGGAVNVGQTVELIAGAAGTRKVAQTTGPSTKAGIVSVGGPTDVGTGNLFVAFGDGHILCTTAVVSVGDLLRCSATAGRAETAPSADEFALWIAETDKAAGSEGFVRVKRRL